MKAKAESSMEPGLLDYLRNIYFFNSMPEDALVKIRDLCTERRFEKDDILFFEDMPGDSFFIVSEGELEVWKRYGQSDSVLLSVIGPGHALGEMALIDERPRSATVRVRSPVRAYAIQASDFTSLMLTDAAICVSLLRAVTMMVRRSNDAHILDLDRQNRELSRAYTELQALQDELVSRERLSVIGKFSSLILHDIRNPLSALKSRIELLRQNWQDRAYFDESLTKINADISRMEMLAAEFLDYARGDIRLNMSISSIDDLLGRFSESMSQRLEKAAVALTLCNEVSRPVILDTDRILRVLINAGENACKAMPSGGKLAITVRVEDEKLIIVVRDTGCGMSPEVLAHIFEPFFTCSAGGTGLGMIIIKSIVDAHHGEVTVDSKEGVGTVVSIFLPLVA